jgi:hypothetical protein
MLWSEFRFGLVGDVFEPQASASPKPGMPGPLGSTQHRTNQAAPHPIRAAPGDGKFCRPQAARHSAPRAEIISTTHQPTSILSPSPGLYQLPVPPSRPRRYTAVALQHPLFLYSPHGRNVVLFSIPHSSIPVLWSRNWEADACSAWCPAPDALPWRVSTPSASSLEPGTDTQQIPFCCPTMP